MPSPTSIAKIGRIQGLGLFKDWRVVDNPEFRQYNLVYGFNGSGKTTLSRIFASIGSGARSPNLPDEGTFEVQLSDGTLQSSSGDLTALQGRILVFNTDFIEESFHWKQGEARPVFYIGKEQAELAQKLTEATAAVAAIGAELRNATERQTAADRAFTLHKRNAARSIAEQLGLGRKYDASNLTADYATPPDGGFKKLTADEQKKIRAVLAQTHPLPKLPNVQVPKRGLDQISKRSDQLARLSLGEVAIADLRGHEVMREWIGVGLKYHQEHDLKNCLFCGNGLEDARRASLGKVVDDAFENLMRNLNLIDSEIVAAKSELSVFETMLPRVSDFGPSLQTEFIDGVVKIHEAASGGLKILESLEQLVSAKKVTPHRILAPDEVSTTEKAREADELIAAAVLALNVCIDAHNKEVDSFDQAKATAVSSLKHHLLAEGESTYSELAASFSNSQTNAKNLQDQAGQLRVEEEDLRKAVRSHGPAADRITKMIHNYLGRRDLVLETADEGYRLRRNGKLVRGSLSEGEKTAIAICYFITTLEAENRKRKDLIVVVDDPVSSLDTRALNYSFAILKAMVTGAGQVFLLTHNLHFMGEVRKWLKPKTEKELKKKGDGANATAALLFLDAAQPGGPETRTCHLRELPKHIRDYESEYHYLLHLILRFVSSPDATEYFFLMPNALRKVLDIFLAFKIPGPDGLGSKIARLVGEIDGIDPARIQALERLAQVESHADNLDDLISFSSTTVEEVRIASETLLELMAKLDGDHFKEMKNLCA